jgi:hypothetical protein
MMDRFRLTDFFYGFSLGEKREFIKIREQLGRADLDRAGDGERS